MVPSFACHPFSTPKWRHELVRLNDLTQRRSCRLFPKGAAPTRRFLVFGQVSSRVIPARWHRRASVFGSPPGGVLDELSRAAEKGGISGLTHLRPRAGAVFECPADQGCPLWVKRMEGPFAGGSF